MSCELWQSVQGDDLPTEDFNTILVEVNTIHYQYGETGACLSQELSHLPGKAARLEKAKGKWSYLDDIVI